MTSTTIEHHCSQSRAANGSAQLVECRRLRDCPSLIASPVPGPFNCLRNPGIVAYRDIDATRGGIAIPHPSKSQEFRLSETYAVFIPLP
jgi:hypothetical protein